MAKDKGIKVSEDVYGKIKEFKGERSYKKYLEEVIRAIEVLENVRKAFKVVTGKEYSLEDTIRELVALGITDREGKEAYVSPIDKESLELLVEKWRFIGTGFPEERTKNIKEAVKNFFYIPDRVLNGIKEKADERKDCVPKVLLEALDAGVKVVGRAYFVLDKETSDRVKEFMEKAPPNEVEKFRKEVKRFVNMKVNMEIRKRQKKLSRR